MKRDKNAKKFKPGEWVYLIDPYRPDLIDHSLGVHKPDIFYIQVEQAAVCEGFGPGYWLTNGEWHSDIELFRKRSKVKKLFKKLSKPKKHHVF